MLRSSAGNFYNYFRPGAGELIRSTEPRRFLSLSLYLSLSPFPSLRRSPPYHPFLFFSLYLHHHLAFLTTHGPSSSIVPLFFPSFFLSRFSSPALARRSQPFLCLSRYCSESGVVLAKSPRECSPHGVSKHLGRISPAVISLVRHYQ